jgi:aspartate beta-hydroxylase
MMSVYDRLVQANRTIYDASIDTPAVLEMNGYFPNAGKFIAQCDEIAAEVASLGRRGFPKFHELMPEQADIAAKDGKDWRMFVLKAYGVAVPENLSRVPKLASLVEQSPEVLSAAVSVLAPQKRIPEHRGPFRGILRFHLILQGPLAADGRPATLLTINGAPHRLAQGQALLWDDTYPHAAANESNEERIALLLDVRRPHMPAHLNILSELIAASVRLGMKWRGVQFAG